MHYVDRRPLIGYGYESFWTAENIEDLSESLEWRFRQIALRVHRHGFSAGLIGTSCLFLIVIIGIYSAAVRCREPKRICCGLTLGILIFGLVDSFLESGMVGENFDHPAGRVRHNSNVMPNPEGRSATGRLLPPVRMIPLRLLPLT